MRTIKRHIAGVFIFSSDNKILLGKSHDGGVYKDTWIVPGGGMEQGETFLQAALRETMEEVGINIRMEDVKELHETYTGVSEKTLKDTHETVRVEMIFHNFIAYIHQPSSEVVPVCGDDIKIAQWHSPEELRTITITEPMRALLTQHGYLDHK